MYVYNFSYVYAYMILGFIEIREGRDTEHRERDRQTESVGLQVRSLMAGILDR